MIGVSVGFLCIWADIDSGIMKGVMLVLAALTLFMLGILYMTRAGYQMKGTGFESDILSPIFDSPIQEESEQVEIPETVTEDNLDEEEDGEGDEEEILPEIETSYIQSTPTYSPILNDRFDVVLPTDVRHNIETTLDSTDYGGFRPVVRWDSWGQVVLDWVSLEEE
tara:strand:- start:1375 stop:1872 length:498 start_codon:yes stop_codon:yes gene_type:complete